MMKTYRNDVTIPPKGSWQVYPKDANDPLSDFAPFDTLSVENDSDVTVTVMFNGSPVRSVRVDSGEKKSIDKELFNYIVIKNEGTSTSISTNEIEVTIGKEKMGKLEKIFNWWGI